MCLAVPGRIMSISEEAGLTMGFIDGDGVHRDVCVQYVADEVSMADYVIVHVGFTIATLDEEEAQRTFEALREMNRLDELDAMVASVEPLARGAGNGA